MKDAEDLYFVFVGDRLPEYVPSAIRLAQKHSGMRVNLLANHVAVPKRLRGIVNIYPIESFYDATVFDKAVKNINSDHEFRNGFWLRALERFFILAQFARVHNLRSFFHAELDQLLFNAGQLVRNIESTDRKGLFFPFHSSESGMASVFYCNDILALDSLLEFAIKESNYANEMQLLAGWARAYPQMMHALPTMINTVKQYPDSELVNKSQPTVHEMGGVVDAAQLGQWVGGEDPRNTPIHQFPVTKFVDTPNAHRLERSQLEQMKFHLTTSGSLVAQVMDEAQVEVYNLHLHSKVHSYLLSKTSGLNWLLLNANGNLAIRILGTRATQIRYYIKTNFNLLSKRLISKLTALVGRGEP